MVDAVKAVGSDVGITTNGDLLADAIEWVVARRVDRITVSVAGDPTTHAELRSGSELGTLWETVERLVARRGRRRRPRVQVSYLLTRENFSHLPGTVRAAAEARADELFVTHLDCTPSPDLVASRAFSASGVGPDVAESIEAARRAARVSKITFRAPSLHRSDLLVCALDPRSFVFVSWSGRVGPCVNLGLPLEGPIPRFDDAGPTHVEPVIYGNLAESTLDEILQGERYRSFTRPFESRLAIERRFLEGVTMRSGPEALETLDLADRQREEALSEHPFPEPCTGCPKVSGW
jgi:MoaA/NifB/PqqE/SkfB family radical SAM enzyme